MPLTRIVLGALAMTGAVSGRVFHPRHGALHNNPHNLVSFPSRSTNGSAPGSAPGSASSSPSDGSTFPHPEAVVAAVTAPKPMNTLAPVRPSAGVANIQATTDSDKKTRVGVHRERKLQWMGEHGTVADLEVHLDGEDESLVDLESISDMIASISCPGADATDGTITVSFKDKEDFNSAADVWDWVNRDDGRHFILMAGQGDCGWNEAERVLFKVAGIQYDNDVEKATLAATRVTWKEAIHSFNLHIGHQKSATTTGSDLARRKDVDFSIPLDVDLTGKDLSFDVAGVHVQGLCTNCTASGSFEVEASFSMSWFELDEAKVSVTTPGVDVVAITKLSFSGDLTEAQNSSIELFSASPAGVDIPGLVTIGPTVSVNLVAVLDPVSGSVSLTMGGTASIPQSDATMDFLDQDGTQSNGWSVEANAIPLEVEAQVHASASVALTPALGLEASVFGRPLSAVCV